MSEVEKVGDWKSNPNYVTNSVIPNGEQLSGAVDLAGMNLVGLHCPSGLTGTSLTFYTASTLDGTYKEITDDTGAAISATIAVDKYVALNPANFLGVRFLKIKSDSAEGASRTFEFAVRDMQ